MRFRFRLESVLKLREHAEQEAKRRLVEVRAEIHRLEEELERLEEQERSLSHEMMKALTKGMSGLEISKWRDFLRSLEENRKMIREELHRKREEEKERLKEYLQRKSERMSLEKLKERRFREYLLEMDRKDRLLLDEVAERKFWSSKLER